MNNPPLIAHIVYALHTGGLENGLVNIINRLPCDSYRHMVICLTTSDNFSDRIIRDDVPIIQLDKPPGHDIKTYFQLWKVLRKYKPDIVHSRNLAALEAQLVTLFAPGSKRVHGEHGRDMSELTGENRKYNHLRKIIRPLIHHYVTVSKDLKQWLNHTIRVDENSISQIYNGVDIRQFTKRKINKIQGIPENFLSDGDIVLGAVGRLAEVKDQKTLLDAVSILINKDNSFSRKVKLVLVGSGPLEKDLKSHAKSLGISQRIWFAGDRNDVSDILTLMDIFILPSLAEGISNTLLEAMACSLPIIATKVGGTPEVVIDGDQGFLIPPKSPKLLADTVSTLIGDESLRESMGDSGRKRVEQYFNWDKTVAHYSNIYDSLLQGDGQRVAHRSY